MGRQISSIKIQIRRIGIVVVGAAIILATASPLIVKADSVVNFPDEKKLLSGITGLDAGDRSAYAITADGTAWAWGVDTVLLVMGQPRQRILQSKCASIMLSKFQVATVII